MSRSEDSDIPSIDRRVVLSVAMSSSQRGVDQGVGRETVVPRLHFAVLECGDQIVRRQENSLCSRVRQLTDMH